jgi:hypothetical protein
LDRGQGGPAAVDGPSEPKVRRLADLLDAPDGPSKWVPDIPRIEVDEARAGAAGIRKVVGRRLVLFTDLAPDDEVDILPKVFDQAFAQWCAYFGVDPADHADWCMTGFLMADRERFRRIGVMPGSLPPFDHGFAWNYDLWLDEQPSAYYRRHLLLHEGTHGFMNTILRGCGPSWYMEGIAELLGTHHWDGDRLTLSHMPESRERVPMWGRIRKLQDDVAAHRAWQLERVLDYHPRVDPGSESYAWCWALAVLLDRHPRYRERFRQLSQFVLEPGFNDRFRRLFEGELEDLSEEWQVFVANVQYGHDIPRTAISFAPGRPLPDGGEKAQVAADRGWQPSGILLERGVPCQIRASGRYQVADQPQIWWCEPGGVSIRYYGGLPLGILLAAVRAEPPQAGQPSGLLEPVVVGLGTALTPERSGTLYLRINDSPAELDDNAGSLTVTVEKSPGG